MKLYCVNVMEMIEIYLHYITSLILISIFVLNYLALHVIYRKTLF